MKVEIYTDGAARGNPEGPGGYGTVLHYVDAAGQVFEKELSQGYRKTTNNRMELMAAIAGIEALKKPCDIVLYSDSKSATLFSPKGLLKDPIVVKISYSANIMYCNAINCALLLGKKSETI